MDWIRVEDKLPRKTDKVLTYTKNRGILIASFEANGKRYDDNYIVYDITHWMPLPDPPGITVKICVTGVSEGLTKRIEEMVREGL